MKMIGKLAIGLALIGSSVFGAELFRLDFEQGVGAKLADGSVLAPVPPGDDRFLTREGEGKRGRGALFFVDHPEEFARIGETGAPHHNLTYHRAAPFDMEQGTIEFMVRPQFNQISPYPNQKSSGFTLYYCLATRLNAAPEKSPLTVYLSGGQLVATWRMSDGQTVTAQGSIRDWKPGEWHDVGIVWNAKTKAIRVDGKILASVAATGKPAPFDIIMLGGSYDGCNLQGVMDDFRILDSAPQEPTVQPVLRETFPSAAAFERDWELILTDGAKGRVRYQKDSNGRPCVELVRENADGSLILRRRKPLRLEKGTNYRVFGWIHADRAQPDNIGFFRVQEGRDGGLHYIDRFNSGYIYTTFSQLVNQRPGRWDRSIYFFEPQRAEGDYFLCYVFRGSPATVLLSDITVAPNAEPHPMCSVAVRDRKPPEACISDAELDRILVNRRTPVITWRKDADQTRMFIDGEFQPQLIHRSPGGYPTIARFGELQRAGIKMHTLTVFVGGVIGGRPDVSIVRDYGKYDFAAAIHDLRRLLRAAPEAYVLLNFYYGPFPNWEKGNYDEVFRNRDGEFAVSGNLLYIDRYVPTPQAKKPAEIFYPSMSATNWRSECNRATGAFLAELRKQKLDKCVAGFFVTGGVDGQFMNNNVDYSPVARAAFGDWLRQKYGTRDALCQAWRDPAADFAFPTPESLPDWPKEANRRTFLNPATETKYADFQEFRSAEILNTLNSFGRNIRRGMPANAPGYLSICDDLNASHIDTYSMKTLAEQNVFTGISPQPKYTWRRDGYIPFNSSVLDSLRMNGKSNILELDLRTYITNEEPSESCHDYIGWADDPEHFRRINRKFAGMQIAKDMGMWYYDMSASYFYDAPLLKELADTAKVMRSIQAEPNTFRPDVALVFDEKSVFFNHFRTYPLATFYNTNLMQWYTLSSGVPYDLVYLDDLARFPEKMKQYKVLVFLNASQLDDARRAMIDRYKGEGRYLVWMYAPGYLAPGRVAPENIEKVTGFRVETKLDSAQRLTAEPATGKHPLTRDLEPVLGLTDMYRDSCDYPGSKFGEEHDMQRFVLAGDDFEPISRYRADGAIAAGVRDFGSWHSVYVANPSGLSAQLLNNIAAAAGAYHVSRPGLVVFVRSNFLSIHALRGGKYTLTLPQRGQVASPDTGKVIAKNADTLTLDVEAGDTVWLRIKTKRQ